MFDIPDAKRIRRSELSTRSQSSSPGPSSPDPELEAQLQARLASLYGPVVLPPSGPRPNTPTKTRHATSDGEESDPEPDGGPGAQEFEFRLFAAPSQNSAHPSSIPQKIILELEDEDLGEGGFIVRDRDLGYYFAGPAEGEIKSRFEAVARSGEEVLRLSTGRAWGLEVPWRVRVLRVVGGKAAAGGGVRVEVVDADVNNPGKRTKPGKKRRIILRERKRTAEAVEEQRRREMEFKEETEREKKSRRNRGKKVKRRAKEKAKKAEGNQEEGAVVVGVSEGGVEDKLDSIEE
ncbi:uncharacterized protein BP5553_07347 [Venustampulla echinocandica]|uniref:Uncharacterized protein n=1 Tax=Venustampulla echinocandica TaxID=2656787 RepID=A0A370TJ88_9HELO|nr:uncharacterized protein BP5553_07347 [Venustampulla echinocandica]RDL35416.1 hypothetical protein BP5553_07347 [Venustampulla echinocandica]